ncbi:MAG TPA: peptidylprolyl isomerase, partial [Nitrospirota bacterium]
IIVEKVNGVEVPMASLIRMMNRLPPKNGPVPETLEERKQRALDKLALQELAYQQAKKNGLSIGADKIDMAIDNFKENVGGDKQYSDYLSQEHVTEADLRAEIERGLLIELNYSREVLAKVVIPEEDVRKEYEKEKHLYILPEKVSVTDVWVLKNEGKASQKKAHELLRKIKADAKRNPYSLILDGSFIVRDMKLQKGKQKELYEAAKKLREGELSGVITMPNELHILRLEKYSAERTMTFDEAKESVGTKLKVPAQDKRMEEWEQELRKDAKIEIMDIRVKEEPAEQKTSEADKAEKK